MRKNLLTRTPAQAREIYNKWKLTAPRKDSDIFGDKPKWSEKPRHREHAAELAPLLMWRELHRTAAGDTSLWLAEAADYDDDTNADAEEDNEKPAACREVLRALEYRPRELEIVARLQGVIWDASGRIIGGDVAYENGVLVRAGNLRFSDGRRHYWSTRGYDEVRGPEPVGALVGWRASADTEWQNVIHDRPGRAKGGTIQGPSRLHLQRLLSSAGEWDLYDAPPADRRPLTLTHSTNTRRKVLEALGVDGSVPLNAARARHGLAPITKDPHPALPTQNPWGGFLGMQATCRAAPPRARKEIEDRVVAQSQIDRANLTPQEREILDAALWASSYKALGEAVGLRGKNAERKAKKLLIFASNKLKRSLFSDWCGYVLEAVPLVPIPSQDNSPFPSGVTAHRRLFRADRKPQRALTFIGGQGAHQLQNQGHLEGTRHPSA